MRYSSFKIKLGAPAAMLLAAAVTTAASSEAVVASQQPCLTWALHAGAPLAAQNARVFLAKEAANHIRALDRSGSLRLLPAASTETHRDSGRETSFELRFSHSANCHQHAAP